MATTPVEFTCVSGLTLTAELYPFGSDTIGNTGGDSATEATNRKGLYSFSVTEALAGWHTVIIKEGTDIRAVYEVYMVDDTNIHRCHEHVHIPYQDGAVWIDTVNGAAGTTAFLNGTANNPVNSIADALTIAAALKLTRIHVAVGSSITLAATVAGYEVYGVNWTLALGSQDITGSRFIGATVSGTGTTSGAAPSFADCYVGACTLPPCDFIRCKHTGTITMGSSGAFNWTDCSSGRTSTSNNTVTYTTNSLARFANCSGPWNFASASSGCILEYNGRGKVTIAASCTSVTASISGAVDLIDAGTASNIVDTSRYNEEQNIGYVSGKVLGQNLDDSLFIGIGVLSSGSGYENGEVWIDTVNGSAGTTDYEVGTAIVPVNNIANALTIAAARGLKRFRIVEGSTITLAATLSGKEMVGENWTLALGSQDIAGSYIYGATVSGTATSSGNTPTFENCLISTSTLPVCRLKRCSFVNNLTLGSASAVYIIENCNSVNPSAGTDIQISFSSAANTALKMLNCNGYFSFSGAASGNSLIWHGANGRAWIKNTCTSLVAHFSGNIELTDDGATSVISDNARYDITQPVGDVSGKVLGGGTSTIVDVGAWVLSDTGSPIGSNAGAGAEIVDVVTRDEDNNPIDGVEVWITPDEVGSSVIAGTVVSDNNGITRFMLDNNMVYWVWRQRAGFNFDPNPESITVGTP